MYLCINLINTFDILTLSRLCLFLCFVVNIILDELEGYAEQVYYIVRKDCIQYLCNTMSQY